MKYFFALAACCAALTVVPQSGAMIILVPVDSISVSDATTTGVLGTVDAGACCNGTAVPIRSRQTITQDTIQVATFLQFDVGSLTVADVNNPGFSAMFQADYVGQLNTVNELSALVGRNTGGTWDGSGTNNPLHDWGFVDETSTVAAADSQVLLASILTTAPPVNDVSADVSGIVKGWVEGTFPNQGLVVFYDRNAFQGAGFDNPELVITIPEPGATALAIGGLLVFSLRRRR